jgi:hypothetical protein
MISDQNRGLIIFGLIAVVSILWHLFYGFYPDANDIKKARKIMNERHIKGLSESIVNMKKHMQDVQKKYQSSPSIELEQRIVRYENRIEKYQKIITNLKKENYCQVQTKNAPICSAKVHHLVTPIC